MTIETQVEAPSIEAKAPVAKNRLDLLKLLPQRRVASIFRRHYLKRELVIGLIGIRGEGKSGSGACISLIDFSFEGIPIFSNMAIACNVRVEDDYAREYGFRCGGGIVPYKSLPLDKPSLLRFDPKYRQSLIFVDEINMEFAETRRSMSNTNLFFDRVVQQLRKWESSMIYTVIHEMWIDPRLRDLTDIFIKCEDTALSPEGLASHKQTGQDFKWMIYPMSRYLNGISYNITKKPLGPVYFHFLPWRGIYDDKQAQGVGMVKYGVEIDKNTYQGEVNMFGTAIQRSNVVVEAESKWGWLYEKMQTLYEHGISEIDDAILWEYLELEDRGLRPTHVGHQLADMGIKKHQSTAGSWKYLIDGFSLDKVRDVRVPRLTTNKARSPLDN